MLRYPIKKKLNCFLNSSERSLMISRAFTLSTCNWRPVHPILITLLSSKKLVTQSETKLTKPAQRFSSQVLWMLKNGSRSKRMWLKIRSRMYKRQSRIPDTHLSYQAHSQHLRSMLNLWQFIRRSKPWNRTCTDLILSKEEQRAFTQLESMNNDEINVII